jgi:hypothetical protein
MHIHDTLRSNYFGRDDRAAAQSFGSRYCRLGASWCYAKITPAALQRGNFKDRLREYAEAADWKSKFESRHSGASTRAPQRRSRSVRG